MFRPAPKPGKKAGRRPKEPDPPMTREQREELYLRTEGNCEWCGLGMSVDEMHAHHRKRRSQGGLWSLRNIVGVHGYCHVIDGKSIHQNPKLAQERGFLLKQGQLAELVPIVDCAGRSWWLEPAGADPLRFPATVDATGAAVWT